MKRRRFNEEQIIGILKEAEAGATVQELTRKHGIREQTFYRWKSKYGGMEISDAKKLKQLAEENQRWICQTVRSTFQPSISTAGAWFPRADGSNRADKRSFSPGQMET